MKWFFLLMSFYIYQAAAFVQVNPVRFLVQETKFGHFTVRNTQAKPVSVEIESKYFNQEADGKMVPDNSKATDELKKILYSPKSFILGPNQKQVVRFFIKDSLTGPELRTYGHLLTEVKDHEASAGQTMVLTPKVAVAIPIVYRTLNDKNNIKFEHEKLTSKDQNCIFSAVWKNNTHSSYINFEALDKNDKIIFQVLGVSNYQKEYLWKMDIPKIDCAEIKKIKVYDVDNKVYVVSRDI